MAGLPPLCRGCRRRAIVASLSPWANPHGKRCFSPSSPFLQSVRHRRRCFYRTPPFCHPRARPEDPRGPERPHSPVKRPSVFPAPRTRAYNSPIPPRIHRKALRRGGVGAGYEGQTRNLMRRVRGKWSPSGDPGEAAGRRAGPSVSPDKFVGRACGAHKGVESRQGDVRGSKGPVHPKQWKTAPTGSHGCGAVSLRACMVSSKEGHATVPMDSHPPRETEVAGKNRRTGRRKGPYTNHSDEAPPAPRPHGMQHLPGVVARGGIRRVWRLTFPAMALLQRCR